MKQVLALILAFMVFAGGNAAPLVAAPLESDLVNAVTPTALETLQMVGEKSKRKKRKLKAGAGDWWLGPRLGSLCETCAERCEENPRSARCKRCRVLCK